MQESGKQNVFQMYSKNKVESFLHQTRQQGIVYNLHDTPQAARNVRPAGKQNNTDTSWKRRWVLA
jgi:hypothetical protein